MQFTGIKFHENLSSVCRELYVRCGARANEQTMTHPTQGSESSYKDGTIVNDTAFYNLTVAWNSEQICYDTRIAVQNVLHALSSQLL
jgi:hypothetical protein